MDTKVNIPQVEPELVRRFDGLGPRYTSYPTADRFNEAFDAMMHAAWLERRHIGAITPPLSLYVHLPFCENICYYCACNKIITRDHSRASTYLDYLEREVAMQAEHLGANRRISQLHFGGGTPTFLSDEELTRLVTMLRANFKFDPGGEYAIELDPRSLRPGTVPLLAGLGFNRASLGVQDFDPDVQRAVNRIQPQEQTEQAIEAVRAAGFKSVSVDLIYGLPRQSVESFGRTLDRVLALRPDRVALYGYAHLPTRFKPQRRILDADMPTGETKIKIFTLALERLSQAGYVHIGLDHFALPDDELTNALRSGTLHRNFQGYTTQSDCDLLALGVSSISKIGPTYSQNVRTLEEYYDCIDQGRIPVMRGIELTADDLLRRSVIMALMCQGKVSIESIEIAHLINFREYFASELADLEEFVKLELVELEDHWLSVTPRGRLFARAVCMVFDRYLRGERARMSYSRII